MRWLYAVSKSTVTLALALALTLPSPEPGLCRRYTPKAAPGYIDIIASVRLAPGEPTVLTKPLPKGITVVPMHYSTKDGVWEGLPFVVP